MRIFIALELPGAIKKAVSVIQNEFKTSSARVRWLREEALHLTLSFLGAVPDVKLSEIKTGMVAAARGIGPLKLSIKTIGVFPNEKRPRVVWLGVQSPDDRLIRLQERVEQAMALVGFPPEKRGFRPHLTIGRVKSSYGTDSLMAAIDRHAGGRQRPGPPGCRRYRGPQGNNRPQSRWPTIDSIDTKYRAHTPF